jgi:hypothetical protein
VRYQKGVSDRLSQVEKRSVPPEVTAGAAFTLGSHETLAGWKVLGYYEGRLPQAEAARKRAGASFLIQTRPPLRSLTGLS